MFGPEIGSLRDKMVRHTPGPVVSDYILISPDIFYHNRNLYITAELMIVNKINLLINLGQRLKFTTIENLPNHQAPNILKRIRTVISLYNK